MTRYLISFDDGAMDFPEDDLPEVSRATHEVVAAAKSAGVWVTGGGLHTQRATVVDPSGAVADGPAPEEKIFLGGFSIVDVASRDEALAWAKRFAASCRCAQEIREIMPDPAA